MRARPGMEGGDGAARERALWLCLCKRKQVMIIGSKNDKGCLQGGQFCIYKYLFKLKIWTTAHTLFQWGNVVLPYQAF